MRLSTDQEYLDTIIARSVNEDTDSVRTRAREEADDLIREGRAPASDRHKIERWFLENNSAEGLSHGPLVRNLRTLALHMVPEQQRFPLKRVPLALLPMPLFNAGVIPTPGGGTAIIINVGIVHYSIIIFCCVAAYFDFLEGHPDRLRHHPCDYAKTLYLLAEAFAQGHYDQGIAYPVSDLFGYGSEPDEYAANLSLFANLFVLLHEYGHVVLGHLKAHNTESIQFRDKPLDLYRVSHELEYQADLFAVDCLTSSIGSDGQTSTITVPYTIGILLRFLDFCEHMPGQTPAKGHPRPVDRWSAIRKRVRSQSHPDRDLLNDVDRLFDKMILAL